MYNLSIAARGLSSRGAYAPDEIRNIMFLPLRSQN